MKPDKGPDAPAGIRPDKPTEIVFAARKQTTTEMPSVVALAAVPARASASGRPEPDAQSATILLFPDRFQPGQGDGRTDRLGTHAPTRMIEDSVMPAWTIVPDLLARLPLARTMPVMWRHALAAAALLAAFAVFVASVLPGVFWAPPGEPAEQADFIMVELVTVPLEIPASALVPSPPDAAAPEPETLPEPEPEAEPEPPPPTELPPAAEVPPPPQVARPPEPVELPPQVTPPPQAIEPLPPAAPQDVPELVLPALAPPQPEPPPPEAKVEPALPQAKLSAVEPRKQTVPPVVVKPAVKVTQRPKTPQARPASRKSSQKAKRESLAGKATAARSTQQGATARKAKAGAGGNSTRSPQAIQRYIAQVRSVVMRRMPRGGAAGKYTVSLSIGAGGRVNSVSVSGSGAAKARISAAMRGGFPSPPLGVPVPFRVSVPVSFVNGG